MDQVTFAMPASSTMSRQDQIDLLVNQATAVIVSNYLQHLDKLIDKAGICPNSLNYNSPDILFSQNAHCLSPSELVSLINAVQDALRSLP